MARVHLAARRAAPMPPSQHDEEAVRFWLEGKLASGDDTWVAEVERAVVGYARLAGNWLDDLYVAPAYAHRGIGSSLLELVKSVRPDGFRLWVFASNEPARVFYAGRGLVEIQRTDGTANEERSPDIALAWPGHDPVAFLRALVDALDADLADVLEQRAALTRLIQRFKPVSGPDGRDEAREREIAERMAQRAPGLGADRLGRIISAVITESLGAVEES